jgi:hypothetical protein
MEKLVAIEKILSSNDLGINGTHQAGILIPKRREILSFFPELDKYAINPRVVLYFVDNSGQTWKFNFIYYNNKFRGGTRNEYRLTGMTTFFKYANLKLGDSIILEQRDNDYSIKYKRKDSVDVRSSDNIISLTLSTEWRVINI